MKKIKWCVIGAGGIADRRTIPAIMKDEGSELVAVMDRVPEVAEAIGKKYGVAYYTDEREMLASTDADAVYIGTPVFAHKEQALTALEFGKSVFVEKPITMTSAEAEELVDAFRKAGKQLTVGYMMKHHNLHERAKAMIEGGEIGKPVSVRAKFSCWYPDIPGAWRQQKKLGGGGAFMDLGVHCAELIEYVLDDEITEIKSMTATSTFSYEVEDSAVVIFRTKGGVLGTIEANFNISDAASTSALEIYGNSGYVSCKGTLAQTEGGTLTHLYAPQGDYSAMQDRVNSEPKTYEGECADLYQKQIGRFNELLLAGKTDLYFAEKAVHIQKLTEMVYENAEK